MHLLGRSSDPDLVYQDIIKLKVTEEEEPSQLDLYLEEQAEIQKVLPHSESLYENFL